MTSARALAVYSGLTIFASAAVVALLGANWYGVETFAGNTSLGAGSATGWQTSSFVDIAVCVLAAIAAISAYLGVVAASIRALLAGAIAAAVVLALVVYRVIEAPDLPEAPHFHADIARLWGLWAALGVAALATAGAMAATLSCRAERSNARP